MRTLFHEWKWAVWEDMQGLIASGTIPATEREMLESRIKQAERVSDVVLLLEQYEVSPDDVLGSIMWSYRRATHA